MIINTTAATPPAISPNIRLLLLLEGLTYDCTGTGGFVSIGGVGGITTGGGTTTGGVITV